MGDDAGQPGIVLKGVGVKRADRWILRDVNWTVQAGSFVAILGPNGSGKSTLGADSLGYIWPTSGEVAIDGHRFGETDLNELRHSIRLVQAAGPYDVDPELTAREVVLTGLFGTIGLFDEIPSGQTEHAEELLKKVGLAAVSNHRYSTLSSGERVRALIARALILKPRLLLLDEPTAGLDLLAREQILATIGSLLTPGGPPMTTVLITHHVEELGPYTAQVLLLDNGAISSVGPQSEVLTQENLSRVYRCPLRIQVDNGRYYVRVDPGSWSGLLDSD